MFHRQEARKSSVLGSCTFSGLKCDMQDYDMLLPVHSAYFARELQCPMALHDFCPFFYHVLKRASTLYSNLHTWHRFTYGENSLGAVSPSSVFEDDA